MTNFARWIPLAALLLLAVGCNRLPDTGTDCNPDRDEPTCESGSGPGIYYCNSSDEWDYVRCSDLCDDPLEYWTGECSYSSDRGNDVCWCGS